MKDLVWPVFRLGEKKPVTEAGRVFYSSEYADIDTAETVRNIRLVDDTSVAKPTLGLRRLQLKELNNLYPISTALYFLADLIKLAKSTTWFIDNSGKVFQYKKQARAKLRTHKIKQVLPADGLGCVIEVEGLVFRFKSIIRPQEWERYAAVLYINGGYMLYGYYEYPAKDTWRLV